MSRGLAIAIGVVVLLLAGVAVFVAVDLIGEDETGAEPATTTPASTVAVVRTDLVERETLEGTLRLPVAPHAVRHRTGHRDRLARGRDRARQG